MFASFYLILNTLTLMMAGENAMDLTMIGYDTSGSYSEELPASKAISNIEDKGNCSEALSAYESKESGTAKLLQLVTEPKLSLQHCRVLYQVAILDCSTLERTFQLHNGVSSYNTLAIQKKTCRKLHMDGFVNITIDKMFYVGIESTLGETRKQMHEVMGTAREGKCNGARGRTFKGVYYKNAVFEVHTETFIERLEATYSKEAEEIVIPNRLRFPPNENGEVVDAVSGTFLYNFSSIPQSDCDFYKVILSGVSTVHQPHNSESKLGTIIAIQSGEDVKITLMKVKDTQICGRKAYVTSESKMFIVYSIIYTA